MQQVNDLIKNFNDVYGDTLNSIKAEYNKLTELLTYEEVLLDKKLSLSYQNRVLVLKPIVEVSNSLDKSYQSFLDFYNVPDQFDGENKLVMLEVVKIGRNQIEINLNKLKSLLNRFNGENQNSVVEIIANKDAVSTVLLNDVVNGFSAFCKNNLLSVTVEKNDYNAKLNISGLNAYNLFVEQVGLHKIIDLNGAEGGLQVFVYLVKNTVIEFNENDVEIKATRSSSAGGQHVNTTDSSIRATHKPSGVSVVCEDERSQFQNKARAIENLKEKVLSFYANANNLEIEKQKKEQLKVVKSKIVLKTYNYQTSKIIYSNKTEVLLDEFLKGNTI